MPGEAQQHLEATRPDPEGRPDRAGSGRRGSRVGTGPPGPRRLPADRDLAEPAVRRALRLAGPAWLRSLRPFSTPDRHRHHSCAGGASARHAGPTRRIRRAVPRGTAHRALAAGRSAAVAPGRQAVQAGGRSGLGSRRSSPCRRGRRLRDLPDRARRGAGWSPPRLRLRARGAPGRTTTVSRPPASVSLPGDEARGSNPTRSRNGAGSPAASRPSRSTATTIAVPPTLGDYRLYTPLSHLGALLPERTEGGEGARGRCRRTRAGTVPFGRGSGVTRS